MIKKALIKALLKGEELNKESFIFSVEYHKFSQEVGFIKIEVLDANSEKIVFKFKIQVDPTAPDNEKNFSKLKEGEESTQVGLVQLESKSLLSKLKEGVTGSLGEGRIPFISGLFK